MKISLEHISKKFQKHWIFRDINYEFQEAGAYALLGSNGSGKSTLLRIIAAMQSPSRGKLSYISDGRQVETTVVFPYISFCAPGMEIVEELTMREFFQFHFSFKKPLPGLSIDSIITLTGLEGAADKLVGDFSSGMKQRVKLAQAIFSHTPVLLLDEPCTNLDQSGMEQYKSWMSTYAADRLVIIASNDEREYFLCREKLDVEQFR
ncbi:MAG: ABC transporter ATP-binding protein [Sphingobacteriales bacterium]|nr:MAG: ABC transporter ATP-binding protein [Sphingobacteriales bacterium]